MLLAARTRGGFVAQGEAEKRPYSYICSWPVLPPIFQDPSTVLYTPTLPFKALRLAPPGGARAMSTYNFEMLH